MSSAHRPTWTPAMGKDARLNTKQYSSRDIAAHTKLKYRQPGQNSKADVSRRDLRLELELAEKQSATEKRRQAGLLPLPEAEEQGGRQAGLVAHKVLQLDPAESDEQASKRRKVLAQALLDDKDDSDSEDDEDHRRRNGQPPNGKSNGSGYRAESPENYDDSDDDDDSDEDEDKSETAALMKELEKIKRERAEEKERQEREAAANAKLDKEAEAATSNPLLNLKAALNQNGNLSPTNSIANSTTTMSFSVKRRWDDDVIFKNQARDVNERPKKQFVNDLLRTEFHRRFLKKFIA